MTLISLLASGVLGMFMALGNPTSLPFILSRFDTGQTLPPFQLSILQGTPIHSNEVEGQVLILNFWAT
jgi:hypothetical protein